MCVYVETKINKKINKNKKIKIKNKNKEK